MCSAPSLEAVAINPKTTLWDRAKEVNNTINTRITRALLFAGLAVGATAAIAPVMTGIVTVIGTAATTAVVATLAASPFTYVALAIVALASSFLANKFKQRWKTNLAITLAVVAVTAAAFMAIAANPAAWIVLTAVGVTALGVAIVAQLPKQGSQKMSFEITALFRAIQRKCGKKTWNRIDLERPARFTEAQWPTIDMSMYPINPKTPGEQPRILISSLPNSRTNDGQALYEEEGVGAVFSCLEDFETQTMGFSKPYTTEAWSQIGAGGFAGGIVNKRINSPDHTPLTSSQLHDAADFIQENLMAGRSVLSHCRGGVGRSAMVLAAWLIKYKKCTPQQAATIIRASRLSSTIAGGGKQRALAKFVSSS